MKGLIDDPHLKYLPVPFCPGLSKFMAFSFRPRLHGANIALFIAQIMVSYTLTLLNYGNYRLLYLLM